ALDLEHRSLDLRTADATDAMGWFKLAVVNGELWATGVTWTSEGSRRLSNKLQRYISPAFYVDDDNRVTEIINCALVSMPATKHTPALIAASRGIMTPEQVKAAMDAIASEDLEALKTIVTELIAGAPSEEEP